MRPSVSCDSTVISSRPCTQCGVAWSLNGFHRDRSRPDGHSTRCKECAKAHARGWYQQNIASAEFKERRREQGARADKRWREANQDYVKSRLAEYRSENADAISEQYRRWRLANPGKTREKNQRRRARLLGAFVAPVDLHEIWKRDQGICQLCSEPVDPTVVWPDPFSKTLDHVIPLAVGGTHEPANVQLAHAICNCIKGDQV